MLQALTPKLELDTPREASADAACAVATVRPAVACPPKVPAVARSARTFSSTLMPKSTASCFTFCAPPAMSIPIPSGQSVTRERTPRASARVSLARVLACLPRQISDNRVVIRNKIASFAKSRHDFKCPCTTTSRPSQIMLPRGARWVPLDRSV